MQLQDRGRALRSNRAKAHIVNSLSLLLAIGNNQDGASVHDGLNTHGVGATRHVLLTLKQTAVGLDGALGQVDAMRALGENVVRLVEANMAVAPNAQKLQITEASVGNHLVERSTNLIDIGVGSSRNVYVLGVNVDMIEEMLVHEVVVALGIVVRDTKVLVEVIRADLGEVDIALLVPIDKLVIGANGRIARSKAQNTVGP